MAIPSKSEFVVIKVKDSWSNFSIRQEYKQVWIYGFDGESTDWYYEKPEKVLLTGFSHRNDDMIAAEIIGEGFDDDGIKYIIVRREKL